MSRVAWKELFQLICDKRMGVQPKQKHRYQIAGERRHEPWDILGGFDAERPHL